MPAGSLLDWMNSDGGQTQIWFAQPLKGPESKIYNTALSHQVGCRTTVGNRHEDATGDARTGLDGDSNFCTERIKPGSCGEFVGIKSFAIGHQPAAMRFAIPGSKPAGRRCASLACQAQAA